MQVLFAIGLLLTLASGTLVIRAWWHPTSRAIGQEWTSREGTVRFVAIDGTKERLRMYWGSYEPVVPPSAFVVRLSVDELPSEVFTQPARAPTPHGWERIGFGAGYDPFNGTGSTDQFLPNYNYLAGKEWFKQNDTVLAKPYKFREWAARNVSGLRMSQITRGGVSPASVVLFHDRYSTFHSDTKTDIYNAKGDGRFYGSFGYLDGRAEGHAYRNVDEYIGQVHRPIRQSWFGENFTTTLPEQYAKP